MPILKRVRDLFSKPKRDEGPPVDEAFSFLPESATSLAILAGAGISLDSPSNLLAGWDFMEAVLARVMPGEVKPAVAQSLISVPKRRWFRPGEYVRFEMLMMELVQSGIDRDLRVLDCLEASEHPNANHFILAELIRHGAVVITTNFDRLIEIAYQRTAKPGEAALRVVYDDGDFLPNGPGDSKEPVLWKLHGSLSANGKPTRASIQATLVQIMWPSMSQNKRMFLQAALAARDVILIGYSGSDDLDIVPVLADTASARAMLWVNHVSNVPPSYQIAPEVFVERKAILEYDVVGRDRVFFARAHPERPTSANPSSVILICAATREVVQELQRRYCPELSVPSSTTDYKFGLGYPDIVRRYFDDWIEQCSPRPSSRYQFAINMLSNRSFRPGIARLKSRLEKRHRELIGSPEATPEEQLECLMLDFNSRHHPDPPTAECTAANKELFSQLQQLIPHLPANRRGTAYRLSACALWNQKMHDSAEALLRQAMEIDRELGQPNEELATLTTWQRGTHSMRDHLSFREHCRLNELAPIMSFPIFPDDAFHRLQELANQTGYKINIWSHLLETFDLGYVEEDSERKRLVRHEARNMLRAAVDLGDVRGEAKARMLLALSLYETQEFEEAIAHAVCILELGKVLDLGELGLRASALLQQMTANKQLVKEYARAFSRSMWA